jgi:type IV pilus assembly protein PilQ
VSTPKVTTLNGEQATISQGTKIPYSSVSDQGTDVQFENAELKLSVTPEINPDGSILLEIDTSNSSVGAIVPQSTGGDAVSIEEKKAQTKVLVRNGQTTVIGGIFVEQEIDSQSGVPILMNVPVLGHLFKSTVKTKDRRELLIFITPRIVES